MRITGQEGKQTSADTQDADGYYIISLECYVSRWLDHQVMTESKRNQQYVAVVK